MTNPQLNNEREISIVKEVEYIVTSRKIRIVGIAIILGIIIVYVFALLIPAEMVYPDKVVFNYISLIACFALCFTSFNVRKFLLKAVSSKNFSEKYFTAHVLSFAQCDLGGLLCIITNLIINENFIFATTGLFVSIFFLIINFPRSDDLKNIG